LNGLLLYLQEAFFIKRWTETEETHLNSFLVHLWKHTEQKNSSLRQTVSRIRRFFRWLYETNRVLINVAENFLLPKAGLSLPVVLTESEISKIIEQPDTDKAIGVRDRAILETLYATGIRHGELYKLNVRDFDGRTLSIREGKGRRERIVPLTANASNWIEKYMATARIELMNGIYWGKGKSRKKRTPSVVSANLAGGQKPRRSCGTYCDGSHLPAHLRHSSSAARSKSAAHSKTLRTSKPRNDGHLHAGRNLGLGKSRAKSNPKLESKLKVSVGKNGTLKYNPDVPTKAFFFSRRSLKNGNLDAKRKPR
jgi:integrase